MQKSARNPRDPDGRYRTFQGEVAEARTALQQNRLDDAIELLASARSLAKNPDQQRQVDEIQASIGRTQHLVVPDTVKD